MKGLPSNAADMVRLERSGSRHSPRFFVGDIIALLELFITHAQTK